MESITVGYTEAQHYRCLEDLEVLYTLKSINPIYLSYLGIESCKPSYKFGPYVRANYVIHVVTGGKGTYKRIERNETYTLEQGQAFMIYPGEETEYKADKDDPWSYIWFGFNGYWAETVAEEIGFTKESPIITVNDTEIFFEIIERIFKAREITFANGMRRKAAFYDALVALMELNAYEKPRKRVSDIKYVNIAVDLMAESIDQKIKIAEIADKIGINRSYLANIFRREMGMSPQKFLINYRLERAAKMLKESEEPISNIAGSVGYSDSLAFSKAFKQKFGVSPSIYRNLKIELIEKGAEEGYIHIAKL